MKSQTKGNLYILMTAFLWSTGGILIKYIPGGAMAINGARSLVALVFFLCYEWTSAKLTGKKAERLRFTWKKEVVMAALCLTLTNVLYVTANKLTTAANAIVLQYTAPIFVLLWHSLYRKQWPTKRQLAVVAMAFLGMVLFFCDELDGGHLIGNILAVCAGVCFSGVFFINSLPEANSDDASKLAFLISFLVSIPFLGDVASMDTKGLTALIALGVFQVGLAYVLFGKGAKLTNPVSASLIGLLEAILNPLWVFLFYGEKMGKFAALGAVLILGAVVWNQIGAGEKAEDHCTEDL